MKQKFSNRHLALYSIIIVQHLLKASLINYYRNSIYVVSVNILFISDDNKHKMTKYDDVKVTTVTYVKFLC